MLGGGNVASFLAKLGGGGAATTAASAAAAPSSAPVKGGGASQQPVSTLNLLRSGPEPLSFVWTHRRPALYSGGGGDTTKAAVGLVLDSDMVVRDVVPHSPADDAQVRRGLVLHRVNDIPVRSEAALYVQLQKSPDCVITFYDAEPIGETIAKVITAPTSADGSRFEDPDLQELYASNPVRYGFLAGTHPLYDHWTHRYEKACAARDALHKVATDDRKEQAALDERKRQELAAQAANLDDLLMTSDDDDAAAPSTTAASGAGPQEAVGAPVPFAESRHAATAVLTAEEHHRLQGQGAAAADAQARPAPQRRAAMFMIADDDEHQPTTLGGTDGHGTTPLLPTPAAAQQGPAATAAADRLRTAIMGAAFGPFASATAPPGVGLPAAATAGFGSLYPGPMVGGFAPHASAAAMPMAVPPPASMMLSVGGVPIAPLPPPSGAAAPPLQLIGALAPIPRQGPKPAPPPGVPPRVYERDRLAASQSAGSSYGGGSNNDMSAGGSLTSSRHAQVAAAATQRAACVDYRKGRCTRRQCVFAHPPDEDFSRGGHNQHGQQQRGGRTNTADPYANAATDRGREGGAWRDRGREEDEASAWRDRRYGYGGEEDRPRGPFKDDRDALPRRYERFDSDDGAQRPPQRGSPPPPSAAAGGEPARRRHRDEEDRVPPGDLGHDYYGVARR